MIKIRRKSNTGNQIEDKFFKGISQKFPNVMSILAGADFKHSAVRSDEQVILRERIQRPDLILDGEDDKSLIIEFQSTIPTKKRLEEMMLYVVYDKVFNNKMAQLCIICTDIDESYSDRVYISEDSYIPFRMISLKEHYGDKILLDINEKVKNHEELTEWDQAFLALMPFTKLSKPVEDVIYEVASLTNEVMLDDETRQLIKSLQSTITVKLVPEDKQESIRRVIKMNNNLFKEELKQVEQIGKEIGRKEGRVEGRKEGRAEGRVEGRAEGMAEGRKEGMAEGKEIGREIERVVIMEKMRFNGFDESTIQEIIQ